MLYNYTYVIQLYRTKHIFFTVNITDNWLFSDTKRHKGPTPTYPYVVADLEGLWTVFQILVIKILT